MFKYTIANCTTKIHCLFRVYRHLAFNYYEKSSTLNISDIFSTIHRTLLKQKEHASLYTYMLTFLYKYDCLKFFILSIYNLTHCFRILLRSLDNKDTPRQTLQHIFRKNIFIR